MKTYQVHVDGKEKKPIVADDYDKAMMIAKSLYPNARHIQLFLEVMG